MTQFKRILVAVDLTKMDRNVLRYVQYMKNVFNPDKIIIGHVVPHSLYAAQYFTDPVEPLAKKAIEEIVNDYPALKNNDKVEIVVGEGSPVRSLLEWTVKYDIDLVVVGKKKVSKGSGVLPRKLIRKSPCPILFVPKFKEPSVSHLWLPVDFSDPSAEALKYADYVMAKVKDVHISGHHVVYLPTAVTLKMAFTEEQEERLKADAGERFDDFITEHKLEKIKFNRVITRGKHENPADNILEEAREHKSDLILISPEGHSRLDLLFLGSVAEKLLSINHYIPTLVFKKK